MTGRCIEGFSRKEIVAYIHMINQIKAKNFIHIPFWPSKVRLIFSYTVCKRNCWKLNINFCKNNKTCSGEQFKCMLTINFVSDFLISLHQQKKSTCILRCSAIISPHLLPKKPCHLKENLLHVLLRQPLPGTHPLKICLTPQDEQWVEFMIRYILPCPTISPKLFWSDPKILSCT